MELRRVS